MGGLQLIRAAWATRSPALDASQQLKGEVDFAPAAALPGHLDLLASQACRRELQEVFSVCNCLISFEMWGQRRISGRQSETIMSHYWRSDRYWSGEHTVKRLFTEY
jgi:hypothetical protein